MTGIIGGVEVGQWVLVQGDTGAVFSPETSRAIGFERNGKVIAGFVFENFNGRSMVAHMAIHGRATREFYAFCADYVFNQARVYKLIAPIATGHRKSIDLAKKIGFVQECEISNAHPNGDILIFTLTAANCRFLKGAYRGKAQPSAVA